MRRKPNALNLPSDVAVKDSKTGKDYIVPEGHKIKLVKTKVDSPYGEEWFQMSQVALVKLATEESLTATDYRILMYLMSQMQWSNVVPVDRLEVAEMLHVHFTNVSKSLTKLTKLKVIELAERGRIKTYKINKEYGWKGKVKNFNADNVTDISAARNKKK